MSLVQFITALGFVQGLLFAAFITFNENFKNSVNKYFALFILLLVVISFDAQMSCYYEELNGFWSVFFDLAGDDIPWVTVLYVPLFIFFVRAAEYKVKLPVILLCVPFFCFLLLNILIDLDLDFNLISLPFLVENRAYVYDAEDLVAIILSLSLHGYVYFFVLKKSENVWLTKLWRYLSLLILLWFYLLFNHFTGNSSNALIEASLWVAVSFFIYWLIYSGLFQFNLTQNRLKIREKLNTPASTVQKESTKSKATDGYFAGLQNLMQEEALYRDENLSRDVVAEKLNISSSYLTQLLKEHSDKSFTAFVNEYRVRDVERMLSDVSFADFDVLSIGLEAGFKSKSAFYSVFKKINGMTPAQYQKKVRVDFVK